MVHKDAQKPIMHGTGGGCIERISLKAICIVSHAQRYLYNPGIQLHHRQGNLQVVKKDSHDLLSPKIKQVIEDIFITIRKPEGIRETPEFVSMYFCLGALF